MGDMIQWQTYNVASPLDAIAARYASQHETSGMFPIGNVDLGVADVEVSVRARGEAPAQESLPAAGLQTDDEGFDPELPGVPEEHFEISLRRG